MTSRAQAVREGRAFIDVRRARTGRLATVGVCPGCWNSRSVRPKLLAELAARGLAVVHGADGATGLYRGGSEHAPRCPRGRGVKGYES
jgi:hypothetical protein